MACSFGKVPLQTKKKFFFFQVVACSYGKVPLQTIFGAQSNVVAMDDDEDIRLSVRAGMYPPHHMTCVYPPPHMTCMYPPPHMTLASGSVQANKGKEHKS
jgi:hypothetical protein